MRSEAYAWAAIAPDLATPPNFINEGTVRRTRQEVMQVVGGVWDADWRRGWKKAYRLGWRIERVVIRRWGSRTLTDGGHDA